MLTLSQILVVHNGRYGGRSVHNMRKLQLELREMDINLHSLMLQNVPSIELNRRLLQNQINAERIAAIIRQAAEPQLTTKRTASADEGQGSHQQYEQENYQSQQPRGTDHLTLFPGLVTGDIELLRGEEAQLLYMRNNAAQSVQPIAQQSVLSPTQQRVPNSTKSNNSQNEAVPNVTQTVLPSANQLDQSNPSSPYYLQRRHRESSNNTNSSYTTDSIHKQNHSNNVAKTFHLDLRNSLDDINRRTRPSVGNMTTKHSDFNSLSHDHHSRIALSRTPTQHQQKASTSVTRLDQSSVKESPPTKKTQQTSQSKTVSVDTTQRALSYCPSIPPGLRK